MHVIHFSAFFLLLVAFCQAACQGREGPRLCSRGSGSRSPSPSRWGGQGSTHESTGLLGDIVRQGTKRPATPHQASHSTHIQAAHSSQPTHPPPAHTSQLPHPHPAHSGQPAQAHPAHQLQSTPAQVRPKKRPYNRRPKPTTDTAPKHQPLPRLGQLVAGLHSVPYSRKAPVHDVLPQTQQHTNRSWWKKPGGRPPSQIGTGTKYEEGKKYREAKKLKMQKEHLDGHPSGHQHHPPQGGGPGSPGAGSHAVAKRRLSRFHQLY